MYYGDWRKDREGCICPRCGSKNLEVRAWESDCGGYTDYQHKCLECPALWWVEGSDY